MSAPVAGQSTEEDQSDWSKALAFMTMKNEPRVKPSLSFRPHAEAQADKVVRPDREADIDVQGKLGTSRQGQECGGSISGSEFTSPEVARNCAGCNSLSVIVGCRVRHYPNYFREVNVGTSIVGVGPGEGRVTGGLGTADWDVRVVDM
ncbi:hypothetical protein Bbelb_077730 [Branchiostoma belcheri]|nr:hypothetical protein Bbelb_077730 [Branchiostoma belcheri]